MEQPAAAIVLGGSANAFEAVRSLTDAGVQTWLIGGAPPGRCPGATVVRGQGLSPALAEVLGSLPGPGREAVIVATGDGEATWLSGIRGALPPALKALVPAPAAVTRVLDKAAFAAECAASGIPAPATAVLRDEAGWERAATLRAPYVAKAVRTHSWHPHLGPSVRRVETAAALRSLAERAWGLRTPLLVQEEVPGAPESVFFVGGLYDESHRPLHTFTGQKLLQYPQGTGTSCHAQLVDAPEVAAAADRIAATFGLSGLVDIEFMRDARDGLLKAIEVNPRAGLWHRISSDGACDLTLAYYAHLAGRPALTSGYRANEPGRRWVYPANHLCSTTDAFGLVRGIWHWANDVRRADVRCDWHPRDRARWRRLAAKLLRHRRRGAPE